MKQMPTYLSHIHDIILFVLIVLPNDLSKHDIDRLNQSNERLLNSVESWLDVH